MKPGTTSLRIYRTMPGTDLVYGATCVAMHSTDQAHGAICLHGCYGIPGTHMAYVASRLYMAPNPDGACTYGAISAYFQ
eukprot:2236538-Rhodomonas_salina.4